MFEQWLYRGVVDDPCGEFFVVEDPGVSKENMTLSYNDQYWDKRFTLQRSRLPVFLAEAAQDILSAGKYLTVVRECNHRVNVPAPEHLTFHLRPRAFVGPVAHAFSFAAKTVLDLLMVDLQLMDRLRCGGLLG
jgi:gamma-tubulin complex component 2